MKFFETTGKLKLSSEWPQYFKEAGIISASATNEQTLSTINKYYKEENYLLDPHTAVGVYVASENLKLHERSNTHLVCLATAHPAKFIEAIEKAIGIYPLELPQKVSNLKLKKQNVRTLQPSEDLYQILKDTIELNYNKV